MLKKSLFALALLACTAAYALAQQAPDPCQSIAKISVPINQATSTTVVSAATARKNYICALNIVPAAANTVSLIETVAGACGAATPIALIGGTTAASGLSLAANAPLSIGSGAASAAVGTNAGYGMCLLQSGTGRVSGVLIYVQQ